ncbi:hypothetical protein [Halonotius pteroides]|uniref:Uncharacterized protein n=1 Tax=Halonotius pteroides TaxID=268735 RepID=A0A3A6Q7I2_9EURY|nr:hypothetical protein [Halonotius pteroides]RJX48493.1 hypothetical protein DP106_12035 [Halonotius pteroides]
MTPRGRRLLAVALLVGLLAGLSVWHGTLVPHATDGRYPGPEAIVINEDVPTGDAVTVWGTVVAADPVVIETEPRGQSVRFTLTGEPVADVSVDTTVGVHGTLASPNNVAVDHALLQESWELQYLYGISAIAGLWVLGRFLRGWYLDGSTLSFQPRSQDD